VSRATDIHRLPDVGPLPPLPIVDWARIGSRAPVPLADLYDGPDAALPKADVAVLTYTDPEWSALDHVFLNSSATRPPSSREWEQAWHPYRRDAPRTTTKIPGPPLWGLYRLVDVVTPNGKARRVILFKCDTHLAHPPYLAGLAQFVGQVLDETGAGWIWSIGTAGGSRLEACLGDVVVTNAAHITLRLSENAKSPINNRTFTGTAFPPTTRFAAVQNHLFFDIATVVTTPRLERLIDELRVKDPHAAGLTFADLVNEPLSPKNLRRSRILPMKGTPLLTTDYYYIAGGAAATKWAALEMDDAVIAWVAAQKRRSYTFARNISDTVVPSKAKGKPIADPIREDWSGQIYEHFGLYTSFNGALATWAALTAS
jgi:hypothetical protein